MPLVDTINPINDILTASRNAESVSAAMLAEFGALAYCFT